MKIITQISLFDDTQNENLGDLERLQKVFENLPDEKLNGKAIQSYVRRISEKNSGNRGERDANWCQKNYTTTKPDGEKVVKTKKWFGFRLHLLSDATYEMPVDFEVTKASNSEVKENEKMLDNIK